MEYGGKNPNGINQVSQSLLSIDVQGVEQATISTSSVDINTSLNVDNSVTASSFSGSFRGDGSELNNIPTSAEGEPVPPSFNIIIRSSTVKLVESTIVWSPFTVRFPVITRSSCIVTCPVNGVVPVIMLVTFVEV